MQMPDKVCDVATRDARFVLETLFVNLKIVSESLLTRKTKY